LEKRNKVWETYKWQYPGLNQIVQYGTVNSTVVETSKSEMKKIIKQYPQANVVLGMWDQLARGAVDAIMEEKLGKNYLVYSVDISNDNIQKMREEDSPWTATVALDSKLLGNMSVMAAKSWILGANIGKYIVMDPVLITRDFLLENNILNMDDLVKSLPSLQESSIMEKYTFSDLVKSQILKNSNDNLKKSHEKIINDVKNDIEDYQERVNVNQPIKKKVQVPKKILKNNKINRTNSNKSNNNFLFPWNL